MQVLLAASPPPAHPDVLTDACQSPQTDARVWNEADLGGKPTFAS